MAFIIGFILFVIALMILGLIYKKRMYDNVDRLDAWKMEIMNKDTAGELSKIKQLNLTGQTKENFEQWKERWETIVTKDLLAVEDDLFDLEEAADRYRFSTAKKKIKEIENKLQSIEEDNEEIIQELHNLLDSEKESREEISLLKPILNELRKTLTQHRFEYKSAEPFFNKSIEEIDNGFKHYDQLVEDGSYLEAKELVDTLKEDIENLSEIIDEFPTIQRICKADLPNQLDELEKGIKGMRDDGYHIDHLSFKDEIKQYYQRILDCLKLLEKGKTEEVKSFIEEIELRIKDMYEQLEKEAVAKNYIEVQIPKYEQSITEMGTEIKNTRSEVELLKRAYYFEDSDMEQYLSFEKWMTQLEQRLVEFENQNEDTQVAHTETREKLESGFLQLEELKEKHEEFKQKIHRLRKDERYAKEKLTAIKSKLNDITRSINKSNIPGVPNFVWDLIANVAAQNDRVMEALDRQPVDIQEVQAALNEAENLVQQAKEQIELMLDQAFLTEQVIQYANRYRSRYPILAAKLQEAERLFRSFEYELALEEAAKAIEEIEPGALKLIEANYQEALN